MKSFLALIILIFLTACTNTRYYYYPENYKNSDISISASLVEFGKEDSALDYIWVLDLDALNKGAQTKEIFSGTVEDYKKQKK